MSLVVLAMLLLGLGVLVPLTSSLNLSTSLLRLSLALGVDASPVGPRGYAPLGGGEMTGRTGVRSIRATTSTHSSSSGVMEHSL